MQVAQDTMGYGAGKEKKPDLRNIAATIFPTRDRESSPFGLVDRAIEAATGEKSYLDEITRQAKDERAARHGQNLDEAIQAAQRGEAVRPESWTEYETGLPDWGNDAQQYVNRNVEAIKERDGVWQEPDAYDNFIKAQNATAFDLTMRQLQLMDFYDSRRDVYGDETVDSILSALKSDGKRLNAVTKMLEEEKTFRGQFLDQEEFDFYQWISKASPEELKQRNEELNVSREEITAQYRITGDREAYLEKIGKLQQEQNKIMRRYYELDNETALAEMELNPEAANWYQSAKDIQADMDKVAAVMAYATGQSGDPAKAEEYKQYLFEKYGLDQKAVDQFAIYGANGSHAARTDGGYNNIYDLYLELQEKQRDAVDKSGYDYDRLTRYEQAKEDAERYEKEQEALREWVQASPWNAVLGNLGRLFYAPAQAVDAVDMAIRSLVSGNEYDIENYVPLNVYNMGATNYVSGVTSATAEQIEKAFPNAEIPKFELFGEEFGGINIASFAYQTTMSMGDSLLHASLMGTAGLAFMAGEAAANQMQDVIARGGNNQQVLLGGLAAGIAEAAFEKFSLEYFLKPKPIAWWKDFVKNVAMQAGIEASEETFTEIANILSDAAIMGRDSHSALAERGYMLDGKSKDEARMQVFFDNIGQVLESGAGGLFAGGGMGMFSSAVNYYTSLVQNSETGKNFKGLGEDVVRDIISEGLDSPEGSQSYKLASKLQDKLNRGKTPSNAEVGALYRANVAQIDSEGAAGPAKDTDGTAELARGTGRTGIRPTWDTDALLRQTALERQQDADPAARAARERVEAEIVQDRAVSGPLAQTAREMYMDEPQSPAQAPADRTMQNITAPARTAQEAAQSAVEGARRTGTDTGVQQRAAADPGADHVTDGAPSRRALHTGTAANDITAQQRQAAMENASALVKASEVFGENGRKAFAAAWDGQGDSARYYAGFSTWYQAGLTGKNQAWGPYAGYINEVQRAEAYDAGVRDAAISLAKEKAAAPYAKTAGTEAGLVYDEYVAEAVETSQGLRAEETIPSQPAADSPFQKGPEGQVAGKLTAEVAARINTVAKALGVRVRMVDHIDAGTTGANGDIRGSDILIAKDAADPVAQVFGHELAHRMQELAPEQFRVFRQAAMDHMADSAARAKIDNYRAQGMTIQYEAAMDDVAADYAGQLMENGQVLDEFIDRHRTDRTLLEKLRDAFRRLVAKLTGADRRKAQTAEGKLSAALDAAAEQAGKLQPGTGSQTAEGEVKYSLKEYDEHQRENWANSKRIVVYESQEQLQQFVQDALAKKNLEKKLYFGAISPELAARILKDTGVEVEGYNCTISAYEIQKILKNSHGDQQAEATRGQRQITAQDIELIPTIITSPDSITLGDRLYNGRPVILFSKTINGRTTVVSYVSQKHMDLTVQTMYAGKNKKSLATPPGEVSPVPHTSETLSGTALEVSVPQPNEESKTQYSLKGATITKTYNQLLKENDALRERVNYWRGQTKTTKTVTTDKKSVEKAAKGLSKEYGSDLDTGELAGRLQTLYDAMATGMDGKNEIGPNYAWEQAEQIARDIASSAAGEWSLSSEFPGLKEKLRDTPITISHEYDGDIRNENFRREYRGKLKLSAQGVTNVDAVYAELAESYPGLFPEDITHPADQLEQIMDVVDNLYTVETQSRFSGQMEEAVTGITNEIVEQFFDLPQTKATMADRYEAQLDAAKAHGKQRVAETREQYQDRMQELRAQNREAVRNAIAKERDIRQRQVQALKDRYAQSRKNAKARRADSKARDRLLHIARRLQNAKLPQVNRTLLNEYIGDLDTVSKSMTGTTLAKLSELRDWYSEQKANNKDFIADPKIEKDLERLSKRQIADLSAQEVADLTQVLLNIENEIRTQRKLIDSQERRDVYAAGEAAIRDIEASSGSKPTGLFAFLDKNIVTETLSPLREVRRITGYAKDSPLTKVTQELADGQRAMYDYQMKAEQQFAKYTGDKGFTKSFAGPKAKGIQIQGMGKDGPTTVTITPAMRASLYLHSLNDQNLKHIRDGGITVPDWTLYRNGQIAEAYARGATIRLTPSQVRSITANMTQKERAFAAAAHRYFNVTSKEAINAVSEKLKGYLIAQVENYFPIRTDSSFTRVEFESIKRDGSIEGMGFLKERVDAANPILLRDMGAELEQSIRMHSKYVGLAIPVRNFNKLWNVTTGQWVDTGGGTGYTGAEGGDSYGQTEDSQGSFGDDLREETLRSDTGADGADRTGFGRIAAWAEGAQVQDPGEPARNAVKIVQSYGVRAEVVQDAAIKARNPKALDLTEDGVVYLTDALAEDDAETVAHHAAVHAVKQRGSAVYESFLENTGGELSPRSDRTRFVINLVTDARFPGMDFMDLTEDQLPSVLDELNAVVWGCYKADARNARAQFKDVFTDYDGYIKALKGIMEGESARFREENARAETRAKAEERSSRRFKYADSVQKAVKSKWGETGYGYIEKMMSDLQNGHGPTKGWAKAMNKLRSNYAGAVLTLNASVAMKQAASYPTAAAVLGWGPLAKAMKSFGKVDLDLIAKYTPLQWYRSKGFSTQELGDMASKNKHLPRVLNWVQGVDLITTRKLWKASEYYVQVHNEALNRGTDAYYKAVADIYNQVIEETQPNYTTMQRPQLLRSDDNLIADLQMFKTQPFQNFNIVYDAAGEFTAAMRRGDKAEIKQARAKVGRAVTSQLAQLAVFAGMGMAWAMFRGKKKKYEDEEGELTLQSALSALGKDMAGGALAGIPFGSDAWELLSPKMFGLAEGVKDMAQSAKDGIPIGAEAWENLVNKMFSNSYYGLDAVTVQALNDTIQSLGGMGKLIGDTALAAAAGDKIDWRSAGIKLDGYIGDISKAAGVPWENVGNLFKAVYRQVAVKSLGKLQGEYAAMKVSVDPGKKSGEYYDLLYKALEQGDLDSYFTIREELPELLGKDHNDIDGAMKSRYKDKLEKNPAYSLSQRAYDLLGIRPKLDETKKETAFSPDDLDSKTHQRFQEQRADRWRAAQVKLEGSALYGKLSNADKDKAMDYAWEYAHQTALAEVSGGKYSPSSEWILDAQKAEKQGVQPWEYALNKAAYNTDAAYSALEKGNLTEYKALRGKFMDVLDKDGTSVDAAMRRDYEDKLKENPHYTLNQAAMDLIGIHPSGSSDSGDSFGADDLTRAAYDAYTVQRADTYRETVDSFEDLPSYRDMDQETRDKLASMAYTMAHQTALADNSDGQYEPSYQWVQDAQEDADIETGEFLLWKTAYNMASSDKDANGKAIKGQEKRDKVKAWLLSQEDLTPEQRAYLWGTEYKSAW